MMEILRFVFSSFWIWLGTFLLVLLIARAVVVVVFALRGKYVDL